MIYLIYSIIKIVFSIIVIKITTNYCKEPLDTWLKLVIFNEVFHLVYFIGCLIFLYLMKKNPNYYNHLNNPDSNSDSLIADLNTMDNYNHCAFINEDPEKSFKLLSLIRHSNQLL